MPVNGIGITLYSDEEEPQPKKECKQYDELVAAIVKAVPEIWDGKDSFAYKLAWKILAADSRVWNTFDAWTPKGKREFLARYFRKGRPITLEDVLRWMQHAPREAIPRPFAVSQGGGFLRIDVGGGWEPTPKVWHLGQSLSWHRDNAPETITFLHSLLVHE